MAFWNYVSQYFAYDDYVVGFDPINEPYPGNNLKYPVNNEQGHFDLDNLTPLYASAFDIYKKNDEDSIMWFEPTEIPDELAYWADPVGFTVPPGGHIGSKKHVLNYHSYCYNNASSPDYWENCAN